MPVCVRCVIGAVPMPTETVNHVGGGSVGDADAEAATLKTATGLLRRNIVRC